MNSRKICAFSILAALGSATTAQAQEKPRLEVGTQAGVTIMRSGGESLTTFGLPGGGVAGASTIYFSMFASPNVVVEPHLSLNRISDDDFSITTLGVDGRLKYLFSGAMSNSGYVFGDGAVIRTSAGDESESEFAAGGGIGYRALISEAFAFHIEGRFLHWFDDFASTNEFGLALGIGVVLGPA